VTSSPSAEFLVPATAVWSSALSQKIVIRVLFSTQETC